jgi:tetratricopeptide (TPR) repeat protein
LRIDVKDRAGASSDLEKADKNMSGSSNVRLELARLYEKLDEYAAAIPEYDSWIRTHADDSLLASALNGRCRDRAMVGENLKDALADCDKAISLSIKGSNGGVFESRGLVHLRLGDYRAAIADYGTALRLHPDGASSLYGRGIAKIRRNNRIEGEQDLAAAVKIVPNTAENFRKIGIVP